MKDFTKEPDYNSSENILFVNDPITGGVFARLPKSSFSLVWYPGTNGGQIWIGRPFVAGQRLHSVDHPAYDYAVSGNDFKFKARQFDRASRGA